MTAKRGLTKSYLTLLIGQSNLYLNCLRILERTFFLVKIDRGKCQDVLRCSFPVQNQGFILMKITKVDCNTVEAALTKGSIFLLSK
jgi:hypothetical protein